MDGLSRWDLVLWVVVAYGTLMALLRLFLRRRAPLLRRLHQRLTMHARANAAAATVDDRGGAN